MTRSEQNEERMTRLDERRDQESYERKHWHEIAVARANFGNG